MLQGKCLDSSESGLRVQVADEIPVGSTVFVRGESLGVSESARVRFCRRKGVNFVLGLEYTAIRKS
jgi:hypothetical protein